jgi:hypothetical protein
VDHNWLLDLSYRIMRYELMFPELAQSAHQASHNHSVWMFKYWLSLAWDAAIVVYCLPEVHLGGYTLIVVLWLQRRYGGEYGDRRLKDLPTGPSSEWKIVLKDIRRDLKKKLGIPPEGAKDLQNSGLKGGPKDTRFEMLQNPEIGGTRSSESSLTPTQQREDLMEDVNIVKDEVIAVRTDFSSTTQAFPPTALLARRREYVRHVMQQCLRLIQDENPYCLSKAVGGFGSDSEDVGLESRRRYLLLANLVYRFHSLKESFDESLMKWRSRVNPQTYNNIKEPEWVARSQ